MTARGVQRVLVCASALTVIGALAGCSGHAKRVTPRVGSPTSPLTYSYADTPIQVATDTPVIPATPAPGGSAAVLDDGGLGFTLKVGAVYGRVVLTSGDTEVGIAVGVSDGADGANFSADDLAIGPVVAPEQDAPWNSGDTLDQSTAADRIACAGHPNLDDALKTAGADMDTISGVDLNGEIPPTTGCVTFSFGKSDTPNMVGYFSGGPPDGSSIPDVQWSVKLPSAKTAPTAPSGTVYSVTSDGDLSNVTYATSGGIQQVTSGIGSSFSKNVGYVSNPVMSAQLDSGSTISCTITVDGDLVSHQTSQGQYAVVTCNR